MRRAVAASVRAVAVPTRSSDWPTHSSMRSSSKIVCAVVGRAAQEHVGVHEREVADEDRHAVAEAARRPAPRLRLRAGARTGGAPRRGPRRISEPSMMSSCTSANVCTSSSAAAASITAGSSSVAARADERARAERGAQTLAAGRDELAQRVERIAERGVDLDPALLLGGEQRVDARLDPVGDRIERLGEGRGPRGRGGHGERLRRGLARPRHRRIVDREVACAAWPSSCPTSGSTALAAACTRRDRPAPRRRRDAARGRAGRARRARPGRGALSHRVRRDGARVGRAAAPTPARRRRAPRDRLPHRGRARPRRAERAGGARRRAACGSPATSPAWPRHAAALARLDDLFAAVRATTTYPCPESR